MMNSPVFSDYLTEYQSIGVGPLIYGLVYHVIDNVTRHYPPNVYSMTQVWDEDAVSGICHDFIIEKLLKKGWLDYYLLSLNSADALERVLKRDFRHFLISRKTRTEKTNVYIRIKNILKRNSQFIAQQGNNSQGDIWGLVGWQQKDITQDPHEVTLAMASVQLPTLIRYRADSRKASPLISNPDLLRLVEGTFFLLDKRTSLQVLFDSICNRLGIYTDEVISLDEQIGENDGSTIVDSIADPGIPIETEVLSKEVAEDIFERLSDRQRDILALQFELQSPTLIDIGKKLGISKSTVSNELAVIERVIRESQIDPLEVDEVILSLKNLFVARHITHRSFLDS